MHSENEYNYRYSILFYSIPYPIPQSSSPDDDSETDDDMEETNYEVQSHRQILRRQKLSSRHRSNSRHSRVSLHSPSSTRQRPMLQQQSTTSVATRARYMPRKSQFSLYSFVSTPTLLSLPTHTSTGESEEDLSEVSFRRWLALSSNEWWIIAIGAIGATIAGVFWPIYGLLYGEVLGAYTRPSDEVLESLYPFTTAMIATGVAVGIASFLAVSHACMCIITSPVDQFICTNNIINITGHTHCIIMLHREREHLVLLAFSIAKGRSPMFQ